jgi:hypothetical protein
MISRAKVSMRLSRAWGAIKNSVLGFFQKSGGFDFFRVALSFN